MKPSKFFAPMLALVLGFLGGILLLTYATAGTIYEYSDTVSKGGPLPEVEVIICLAGGRGRIRLASDMWNRYRKERPDRDPPVLFFSGMGKFANWDVLAKQVHPKVLKHLKFKDVVLETESANTRENASFLQQRANESRWKRFLLVTSSYHMKRARYVMVRTLKGAFPSQKDKNQIKVRILSVDQNPFRKDEWKSSLHGIRVTMTEYLKWVYYRLFW